MSPPLASTRLRINDVLRAGRRVPVFSNKHTEVTPSDPWAAAPAGAAAATADLGRENARGPGQDDRGPGTTSPWTIRRPGGTRAGITAAAPPRSERAGPDSATGPGRTRPPGRAARAPANPLHRHPLDLDSAGMTAAATSSRSVGSRSAISRCSVLRWSIMEENASTSGFSPSNPRGSRSADPGCAATRPSGSAGSAGCRPPGERFLTAARSPRAVEEDHVVLVAERGEKPRDTPGGLLGRPADQVQVPVGGIAGRRSRSAKSVPLIESSISRPPLISACHPP